jgi:hypothetical protein
VHWRRILSEICYEWLQVWGVKTLRVLASIYKSTDSSATARWICFKTTDSAAAPDLSTSSSRCALSRGFGYI